MTTDMKSIIAILIIFKAPRGAYNKSKMADEISPNPTTHHVRPNERSNNAVVLVQIPRVDDCIAMHHKNDI